ncbi:uncharacterized protein DUF4365 [Nonlabens dokdonensis]|uniref:DUF4365 domain-containing protein n=2 Tax=Nonlabens dokdonensis TaxID=328515 RepID=L7W7A6_NONDD|nr:DUF4365 domain-containing protein [Nonlabens dokdonensis]AGC76087.1 hypothetical protein DDD_0960 [Nonlabens dokdonensis DSW-6]PZX43758.1 uncharacterized protein DUF4365 [Nonlabens dokdonensis]
MRSKTHILEEKSVHELRNIFPDQWVIREKGKDYGIDIEVEIFDKKEQPTGLVFWIQLKATDSKLTKTKRSINMPIAKINQLAKYDLPVAIFRYNSDDNQYYFDWIKRYAFLSSNSKRKSYTIQFNENQLWVDESSSMIDSDLNTLSLYTSKSFKFPLTGYINCISGPSKNKRLLSSAIGNNHFLINLTRDSSKSNLEINLLEGQLVLNLKSIFGSSVGWDVKSETINDVILLDVFHKALVLFLANTGKRKELKQLITEYELLDSFLIHSPILSYILPELIACDTDNVFLPKIIETIYLSDDLINQTYLQAIVFLGHHNLIDRSKVEEFYNRLIRLCIKHKNDSFLSTAYYNYGSYYKSHYILDKAYHYYNKTIKTDNSYLDRSYFKRELAGLLFQIGRYKCSTNLYKQAIELETDNKFLLATYGDALMYSGNYKVALEYFDKFLTINSTLDESKRHDKYEYSIKFILLQYLISISDIEKQERKEFAAEKCLLNLNEDELKQFDKIIRVLSIDALYPTAWFLLMEYCLKNEDPHGYMLSILFQAILLKNKPDIWAFVSVLCTYEDMVNNLLYDIVNTAFFYCRNDFLNALDRLIDLDIYKDFKGEEFLKMVESMINDPKEYPMEIRLWNGEKPKIFKFSK